MSNAKKLTIKINNSRPLELNELSLALNSLSKEYTDYCVNELGLKKASSKLEVTSIKQGSTILDLVPVVFSMINDINIVYSFGTYMKESFSYFSSGKDKPKEYSKSNCDNLTNILNPVANDNGSNLQIYVTGNNDTVILCACASSLEANAIQNNLSKEKKGLQEETEEKSILTKMSFYWSSASFNQHKNENSQDKGIVEEISPKAKKIIFQDEEDKLFMTTSNKRLKKEWQNLVYTVDVLVVKIQGNVNSYKITQVYQDDTTELDND